MYKRSAQRRFWFMAIVVLLLAACGAPAAPTAPAQSATTAPAAAAPEANPLLTKVDGWTGPALTKDKVTLRVLRQIYPEGPQEQYFKDTQAEFTKAFPNITFEEETVPFGQLFQKVMTTASMDEPPDITLGMSDFIPQYVYNKMALALDPYLTKEYLDDILPAVRDIQSVDGKLYMMPYETQPEYVAFVRAMWKDAGLQTPPENVSVLKGWSWEQFTDAWKKLSKDTNGDGTPEVYAYCASGWGMGGPGSNYYYEGQIIRSHGDNKAAKDTSAYKTFQAISDDGLTATGYVDTPEAVTAMKLYQSWFQEQLTPLTAVPNQFPAGGASTCNADIRNLEAYFPDFVKNNDLGYTPWYAGPKMAFEHVSGAGFFISSKSKHPAEAAAYLSYIHNDADRLRWHKVWTASPARTSLLPKIGFDTYPSTMKIDTLQVNSYAPPLTVAGVEYQAVMNQAIKDIAFGADVAERLHKAAQEIDGILAGYKK